jgi:hypothetical protein
MFSLKRAFNAGVAGLCGAAAIASLGRHQPEAAAIAALALVANVLCASYERKPS